MSSVPTAVKAGMQKLADAMDFRRRMDGFIIVFQKLGQIITGRVSLKVKVVAPVRGQCQPGLESAPGWTDGETVYLNELVMQRDLSLQGDDSLASLMALKGVFLHEVGHCMVSPRAQDDICQRVIKRGQKEHDFGYWHAFNILEDQRMETWVVSRFGAVRRFFEAAVLRWMVRNPQTMGESFVLLYGRKFLKPRIRTKAKAAFVAKYGEPIADEFAEIIDQYLTVIYPTETTKAYTLIVKFRDLLRRIQRINDAGHAQDPGNQHDPDRIDVRREGRPMKQDRKDQQRVKDIIEKAKAEDAAQEAADQQPDPAPSDEEGEGDGPGVAQDNPQAAEGPTGQSEGNGEDQDSDGDGEDGEGNGEGGNAEAEGQGQGGSTEGEDGDGPENVCTGERQPVDAGGVNNKRGNDIHNQKGKNPAEDLLDDINDQLDKLLEDDDIRKDVQDLQRAVQAAQQGGAGQVQGKDTDFNVRPVPAPTLANQRRVTQILKDIKLELEGQWEDGHVAGVLNAQRAMLRKPWEVDIFDLWEESHEEEGGVEAVILLDMSQSMEGIIDKASQALWVTKRAFDELDIPTTVIGYSDNHKILMRADDKAQGGKYNGYPVFSATNPISALKEALHIFQKSKYPNRVLITITDGNWDVPGGVQSDAKKQELETIMRSIRAQAVTTMLLGICPVYGGKEYGPVKRWGKHHHELGRDILDVSELPMIAEHLVVEIMRQVKARV